MPNRLLSCSLVLLLAAQGGALAAPPKGARSGELSVDYIMRGPALYGWAPKDVRWSGDGSSVYFQWKRHDDPLTADYSTYVVSRDGGGLRKLTDEEERHAPPTAGDDTRDWKISLGVDSGDIYLYDRMSGRRHQVTRTVDIESAPRFTRDEKRIVFVRGGNLYLLTPADGSIEQLTDIRAYGTKIEDADTKGTESQEFLKKEEKSLLEVVRERSAKREEKQARSKKINPRKPYVLAKGQSVESLHLAPDESYVLAIVSESGEAAKTTVVPNYLTESGYTAELPSRNKVGDLQEITRAALVDVKTGELKWIKHELKQDGKDRPLLFSSPQWSDDGSKLILTGRAADNKDEWIFAVDPSAATVRPLVNKHDDAWVGSLASRATAWVPNSGLIYFTSERDGWSHLYTVPFDGGEPKALTQGKWEVRDVALAPDRGRFLLTTSETHPGENHVWQIDFDGGGKKRLTSMAGGHDAVMSPDGAMLASIYSYTNKPPELYLLDLRTPGANPLKVTSSPAPEFWNYAWQDVPLVAVAARDGQYVPARLYKPKAWKKGGPLVVFVHGAGYLQNAHRRWSQYSREYLFHHLLMERGYMVLDLDYRASAGYGRDWRTAIYMHMGGKDLDDQVDAVTWAVQEHGVNPKRVGIYGGSYGGFITLMAMFTKPEVFQAGASLRPVTDWAHYNHGYTSNILNTPQKDEAAYRKSSPIYHAAGLKGALLICHGMVDTNVHFQDTVRLTQRLIELRKENWELAVYPAEDHAFIQPSSWADEFRRILKLFDANLGAHPIAPRAK